MRGLGVSVMPLMAGVRTDVDKLLKQFVAKESLRYMVFVQVFREAKFSAIYTGRQSEAELREFEERLLSLALTHALPGKSTMIQDRIAGIYLLYALYYLQPADFRMKIRIIPDQLVELHDFMEQRIKPERHLDTLYCLFRLFSENAFVIVKTIEEMSPLLVKNYDDPTDVEHEKAAMSSQLGIDELQLLVDDTVTQQVAVIHEKYIDMKHKTPGLQSIMIMNESPAQAIKNAHDHFTDKCSQRPYVYGGGQKGGRDDMPRSPKKSPVKDSRAVLKQKAYSATAPQSRHRRHMLVEVVSPKTRRTHSDARDKSNNANEAVEQINEETEPNEEVVEAEEDETTNRANTRSKKGPKVRPTPVEKPKKKRKTAGADDVIMVDKQISKPTKVTAPTKRKKASVEEATTSQSSTATQSKADKAGPSAGVDEEAMVEDVPTKKRTAEKKAPSTPTAGHRGRPRLAMKLAPGDEAEASADKVLEKLMKKMKAKGSPTKT
uniref:snRNA-activating protein complex subunit 1 n=1 Tax=Plectus sambesii TaxID=2011161 RepID=A0A914W2N0_9BILA